MGGVCQDLGELAGEVLLKNEKRKETFKRLIEKLC